MGRQLINISLVETTTKCLRTRLNENNEEICTIVDAYNNEFELSTEELKERVFKKEIGIVNIDAFNDNKEQLRVEFSHPSIANITKYRLLEPIISKLSIEEIEKEYKQYLKLQMLGIIPSHDKTGTNTENIFNTLLVTDSNNRFYKSAHANTAIFRGKKHLELSHHFGNVVKIICKHAIIENIAVYSCIIPLEEVNAVIVEAKYIDIISDFVSISTVNEIFTILRCIVSQGLVSSYRVICVNFKKVGITSKMVYEQVWKLLLIIVDGRKQKSPLYKKLFDDRFLNDDRRYCVLLLALIQLSVSMYISTECKNKDFFYVIDKCNEELDDFIEIDNKRAEPIREMTKILLNSRSIINNLVEKVKAGQTGEQLIED